MVTNPISTRAKTAYRELISTYHPDKHNNSPFSTAITKVANGLRSSGDLNGLINLNRRLIRK